MSLRIVSVISVSIEDVVTFAGSVVAVIVFILVTSGHAEGNCQSHYQKEQKI